MVIEHFKPNTLASIGRRFQSQGRMLPPGVHYHASWVEPRGARCFQLMEADTPDLLRAWAAHWDDLVDFEIVPVLESSDFWAQARSAPKDSPLREGP